VRQAGGEPWVRWLLTAILRDGRLKVAENPGPPGPPGPPGGKGSKGSAAGSALLAAAGSGQVHVLRCLLKAMWSPGGVWNEDILIHFVVY